MPGAVVGNVLESEDIRRSLGFALKMQRALGSRSEMNTALGDLRALVHAASVMHVRQARGDASTVSAAGYDPTSGKLFARPTRSFVNIVLREHLHSASVGTVWFLRRIDAGPSAYARLGQLDIGELAVIPLENGPSQSDYLELQFRDRISGHDRVLLEILGPSISEVWRMRPPGAGASMLKGALTRVAREDDDEPAAPLLSHENPAGLTRAEFMVCALIREGQVPDEIAATLNLKISTIRSHMRSIYSKTGVSGQVALVHRIHGEGQRLRASG